MCGADCWLVSESWLEKILADLGSAQNTQLLHGFSVAKTELLALAGLDSLVLVGQKRGKARSSSLFVREFLLSARPSSPLSNSFFICSLDIGFLPFPPGSNRPAMSPVFLTSFANALMLYLPQ